MKPRCRSREMIRIREFQRRVWGDKGTPLTSQAIRNQIRCGRLPGEAIGRLYFIDWTAYSHRTGDHLVDRVLNNI